MTTTCQTRPTKSQQGRRSIPITKTLAPYLREHALRQGHGREGLVFGEKHERPFRQNAPQRRADEAWGAASLERVTLHACRHLYASLIIAAVSRSRRNLRYDGRLAAMYYI